MHDAGDTVWWNEVAAKAAAGKLSPRQLAVWRLCRLWNWLRPSGFFDRMWMLFLSLFTFYVTLNAGWLGEPGQRAGGLAVLGGCVLLFCLALGPRRVKI